MPISIKNEPTEQLARKLADLAGESLTEAIRTAVEERYERLCQARSGRSLADDLNQIGMRCARLPVIHDLSEEEILGFPSGDDEPVPQRQPRPASQRRGGRQTSRQTTRQTTTDRERQ